MHQNRYQQCVGAFILQAASESSKVSLHTSTANNVHVNLPQVDEGVYRSRLDLICLLCACTEGVAVKDRGRCDHTAEAGLSAAASQELLTVAGVFTDLECRRALHCPTVFVLAQGSFFDKNNNNDNNCWPLQARFCSSVE